MQLAGRGPATGWIALGGLIAAAVVAALYAAPHVPAVATDLQILQRDLNRQLTGAVRAVNEHGATAIWTLCLTGFLYGVVHAAGPGHGKFILSTYLATHESRLQRGVALAVVSAFVQALTAIAAVEITVGLLGYTLRQSQGAAATLEQISDILIAVMGAVILGAALLRLRNRWLHRDPHHGHAHGPIDDHEHHHAHHAGAVGLVLSIGLRPCAGAILILLVASVLQLRWAGIAATFAMAAGTAFTVAAVAAVAVYARQAALRWSARSAERASRFGVAFDIAAALGGAIILTLSLMLVYAASTSVPARPPL